MQKLCKLLEIGSIRGQCRESQMLVLGSTEEEKGERQADYRRGAASQYHRGLHHLLTLLLPRLAA